MDHNIWCHLWYHTGMMSMVILAILAVRRVFANRLSPTLRHLLWVFVPLVICLPTINIPIVVDNANVVTVGGHFLTTPAAGRSVHIISNDLNVRSVDDIKPSTFTRTDSEGIFRSTQPPTGVTVDIQGSRTEQYFAWHGNELAQAKEYEFQMVKSSIVKGRLLDGETKEPLANQLYFYWRYHPDDPGKKAFMPQQQYTNANGEFTMPLHPKLKYEIFIVANRQSNHGGGPYTPKIEIAVIEPSDGDMDLGDLLVAPAKIAH